MDRCRCDEYADAVSKLKFYTVGTLRPDIIDNYDRSGYEVRWIKHGVDVDDLKFDKPKVFKVRNEGEMPEVTIPKAEDRCRIEQMWCPYMKIVRKQ